MQNLQLMEYSVEASRCNVHYLSMFGSPSRTDCNGVYFSVHRVWNSRDVSMAVMCQRECDFYNVIIMYVAWWLFIVSVYLIVWWCLIRSLLVMYVEFLSWFQCWYKCECFYTFSVLCFERSICLTENYQNTSVTL